MRVVLVGCVETKALPVTEGYPKPTLPAKDLYVSPLFRKRRAYAEREVRAGRAVGWGILSAFFGCVAPEREIPGYDWRMSQHRKSELDAWAARTVHGIRGLLCSDAAFGSGQPPPGLGIECNRKPFLSTSEPGHVRCAGCLRGVTIEVHAGADYLAPLRGLLDLEYAIVEAPTAGLQIGELLHWYSVELNPQMSIDEAAA